MTTKMCWFMLVMSVIRSVEVSDSYLVFGGNCIKYVINTMCEMPAPKNRLDL